MIVITAEEQSKASAMFEAGESTNKVADGLFRGYYAKAKQARAAWGGDGDTAAGEKKSAARRGAEPQPEQDWELTVTVSVDRFDEFWKALEPQEKATAIQAILQARIAGE